MAEQENTIAKYFWIILTGIVSLIVGVGGGVIINYFTQKRTALEYELVTSEVFSGQKQNIAILALQINNPGNKEFEDFICRVSFPDAQLTEFKVTGLPKPSYTTKSRNDFFELKAPFINQQEVFSVQLLLSLQKSQLVPPNIEIRGKGVIAKKRSEIETQKKYKSLVTLLATAVSTMMLPVVLLFIAKRYPLLFYTTFHQDDQRDVLAYIFSINGFLEEADKIRSSERQHYYWAQSDFLTEKCLASKDEQLIRRGIKTLHDLINYASLSHTSLLIIHCNIARMAASLDDAETAKKYLRLACKGKHKVIEKRIILDEKLNAIADSEQNQPK